MAKMWQYVKKNLLLHKESKIGEFQGKTYSYGELLNELELIEIDKFLKTFCGLKCVILCQKSIEAVKALLLCWKVGMVAIPVSMQYGKEQCDNIIGVIQPDYIITDDLDFCKYYTNTNICTFSEFPSSSLKVREKENELIGVELIMCTSGTTGTPKGSMFSAEAIQYNVAAIADYFPVTDRDTMLICRPIYHCAVLVGELLLSILVGANVLFYSGGYNPIVISNVLMDSITVLCGTPTILKGISSYLKHSKRSGSLKTIALSGEYLLYKHAMEIRESFPDAKIYNVYGLTEAGPRVTYLSYEKYDSIPQSVGKPLNGIQIKIVDENGIEMKNGEVGNVWVKTPSVMLGYYRDTILTKSKFHDGWFDSGDIGKLDIMNNLYILGRSDDMIIRLAMNIFPQEIERKIMQVEAVKEVLVYGQLMKGIEQIVAEVILKEEFESETCYDILQKISFVLPDYMMPAKVLIVKDFPKNVSGKVIRPSKKIRDTSD